MNSQESARYVALGWSAVAIALLAGLSIEAAAPQPASVWEALQVEPGAEILVRTETACVQSRLDGIDATGLQLRPSRASAPRQVARADVHAIVRLDKRSRSVAARTAATVVLGGAAVAAGLNHRPKAAVALGLLGWWVPWWGEGTTASPVQPAPTPRQTRFVDRLDFYTRDGGTWSSPNRDYDASKNPIRTFGYRFVWLVPRVAVRLTIFGRADDGQEHPFWETQTGWDPVGERALMRQFGTNGAWAEGTFEGVDATHNQINLTFTMPDGEIWRFKEDDTITGPDQFETVSYRFRDGKWVEQSRSVWRRVKS